MRDNTLWTWSVYFISRLLLRFIIKQFLKWRTPQYILFVEFKKAFDAIKLAAIWKALSNKGIPQKIVNIIRATYENTDV